MRKKVIALTSGGIDSIALTWVLALRHPEYDFLPLYFCSKNSGAYWKREHGSNLVCFELFKKDFPNVLEPQTYNSPEIKVSRGRTSYRNQIYLDAVVRLYGDDPSVIGTSMGVCPGQEEGTWIHGWSLDKDDHSPTFLEGYLREKKPEWKLWTFKNFESEFPEIGKKSVRTKMAVDLLGEEWLWLTTSCQLWYVGEKPGHWSYLGEGIFTKGNCGKCFSCVARYVSIRTALGEDKTPYRLNPLLSKWCIQFVMEYKNVDLFLEALPVSKDGRLLRKELKNWMLQKLNG